MNKLTMRGRLLASSMITGAALLAFSTAAHAADATSVTDVVTTGGTVTLNAPASGGIQTVTAAADAAAAADTTTTSQELVVTGSRIPRPNLTSISPIQSVTSQEFKLEGHTDAIDLLNNLPQEFQNNTVDFSNDSNPLAGPGGLSTADLRGLGPQRTLVLVNGRRLGIADANTGNPNPAPDLDQIPAAMIDHVEVVTGGASATYGSDAIAGVVNFILKKDFEGLQVDGTLGIDQHDQHNSEVQGAITKALAGGFVGPLGIPSGVWDGGNEDASVIFGANAPDGKGNVTAYFEYHNQSPVLMRNRDWSSCLFHASNAPNSGFCTGSANSNIAIPLQGPGCTLVGGSSSCTVVGSTWQAFPQKNTSPPAYFNSNHFEFLSRADTRYLGGFEAHYDYSKAISVYSEFNFMDDRSLTEIAPSGLFIGGNPTDPAGGWQVNCNNPFLSGTQTAALGCSGADFTTVGNGTVAHPEGALKDVLFGRRNIEGGPRHSYYEHFNYRGVLGVRGDLGDAWHYDMYGSYYYTFLYQNNSNYLSNSRIGNALDVVNVGGTPTCIGVVDGLAPTCSPYNIFQTGGVSQSALNYLNIAGSESGSVEEQIVEGDFTGDLGKYGVKTPWANDGIGLSVGFDWRRDALNFIPDAIVGSGDLAGGSGVGATINQALGLWEGYFETRIPVIQKMPWAQSLSIEGGLRYSSYTGEAGTGIGFTATTYRAGIDWSPVDDVRFRASYNRAIRAPSVVELFDPDTVTQSNQFGVNGDPCAKNPLPGGGFAPPVLTFAQCENTGITSLAQYNALKQCTADQCNVSTGGTTTLKPETADTFSAGATFTPHWVRGLNFSIDWWDVMEYGFIGAVPPDVVVTECGVTGQAQFCSLIHRAPGVGPGTGFLFGPSSLVNGGYVVGVAQNIVAGQEMGIDFQGDYRLDLEDVGAKGVGSLAFDFNGSYLLKNSTLFSSAVQFDCAGLFGSKCVTINPTWRHTFRVTWNTPWNALFSLQWRYIGSVNLDTNTSNQILNGFGTVKQNNFNPSLPAVNYLDLSTAWRINTALTVRAGVNNVLDQDPPIVNSALSGTGTPNAYPTYDLLGREIFMSATLRY